MQVPQLAHRVLIPLGTQMFRGISMTWATLMLSSRGIALTMYITITSSRVKHVYRKIINQPTQTQIMVGLVLPVYRG